MNAPNRSVLVVEVVNRHRDLFGTDDTRRGLLYYICEEANALDGDEWGVLEKGDRGDFIPSDVIVWRSTLEHFDVLKGDPDDPAWQPHGPITNPTWKWIPATPALFAPGTGPTTPGTEPLPGQPPPPPAHTGPTLEEIAALVLPFIEPMERIAEGLDNVATALLANRDLALEFQRDGIRLRIR